MGNHRIGIDHIKYTARELAVATMSWDEPIPAFETRFPKILESCLAAPFMTYNRKELYPTLEDKGAILFYLLIKNHPFQNGNKRIAVTSLMVFLLFNGRWLTIQPAKLYNLAIWVAQSDAEVRDAVIAGVKDLVTKYSKKIK